MIKSKNTIVQSPILTPTVLTMLVMENNINYIDSGSDLLIRWQVITNFLMELKNTVIFKRSSLEVIKNTMNINFL